MTLRGALTGLSALAVLAGASVHSRPARAEIIDGVAVIVNGEIITLSELEERGGNQLPPPSDDPDASSRREKLLRRLAEESATDKLVEKECTDQGISPTAAEVDNAIEEVQRINNIDRTTLEKALGQQGLTMARYREMLHKQLCQMKVVETKVKSRINIADDDIRNLYNTRYRNAKPLAQMKVRDVFVSDDQGEDEAKKQITAAKKRISSGDDFELVARDVKGPLSDSGGDLGWLKESELAPELKVIASLPEGGVSDIIRVQGGFHILKVEQRQTKTDAPALSEMRDQIRQELTQQKMEKAADEYFAELRRTAEIEYRIP